MLLLADEPTGQLDSQTGRCNVSTVRRVVTEYDITVIVATHDQQVMAEADVVHELLDGRLVDTHYKGREAADGKLPEIMVPPAWMRRSRSKANP